VTDDDDAIRAVVARLARSRSDGGHVVERAAILAAGSDSAAIEAWILAHAGTPEPTGPSETPDADGLHGMRGRRPQQTGTRTRRFLLPSGVL
jgi:hypothetical protein